MDFQLELRLYYLVKIKGLFVATNFADSDEEATLDNILDKIGLDARIVTSGAILNVLGSARNPNILFAKYVFSCLCFYIIFTFFT